MTFSDASMALLTADSSLRVGDGTGKGLTAPYVVHYGDRGQPGDDPTLAGGDDRAVTFQVTAVGASRQQAEWVAVKAERAVLGHVPSIDGLVCGPVSLYLTQQVQRDDDVSPPMFYAVTQYRYTTTPA